MGTIQIAKLIYANGDAYASLLPGAEERRRRDLNPLRKTLVHKATEFTQVIDLDMLLAHEAALLLGTPILSVLEQLWIRRLRVRVESVDVSASKIVLEFATQ